MFQKKKIQMPLLFIVFLILVTFSLPLTLFAGSDNRIQCPCFDVPDVISYAPMTDAQCASFWDVDGYLAYRNGNAYPISSRFDVEIKPGPEESQIYWCSALVQDISVVEDPIIDVRLSSYDGGLTIEEWEVCNRIVTRLCTPKIDVTDDDY